MVKHITADRVEMEISDMGDAHLVNTCRLIKMKAKSGHVVRYGGGTCAEDMWYDEDHLFGEEALDKLNFSAYAAEAKKRGLNI